MRAFFLHFLRAVAVFFFLHFFSAAARCPVGPATVAGGAGQPLAVAFACVGQPSLASGDAVVVVVGVADVALRVAVVVLLPGVGVVVAVVGVVADAVAVAVGDLRGVTGELVGTVERAVVVRVGVLRQAGTAGGGTTGLGGVRNRVVVVVGVLTRVLASV